MKAWSWFAVTPAVFAAAYWATPMLVTRLTGNNVAAVTIAQLNLPDEAAKPAAKAADTAGKEIKYAAFSSSELSSANAKAGGPVTPEFVLQSVMLTDGVHVAVVNGNLVREGDKVGDGYRVAKVEPDAVWLAIKSTSNVKVGKKIKQQTKDEMKVLHFPKIRDVDMEAEAKLASSQVPRSGAQNPASPGQAAGQVELEKDYKQILEKLKL